jgi:hypothetical protein
MSPWSTIRHPPPRLAETYDINPNIYIRCSAPQQGGNSLKLFPWPTKKGLRGHPVAASPLLTVVGHPRERDAFSILKVGSEFDARRIHDEECYVGPTANAVS